MVRIVWNDDDDDDDDNRPFDGGYYHSARGLALTGRKRLRETASEDLPEAGPESRGKYLNHKPRQ